MSNHELLVGGWTPYHSLTEKDSLVFKEALAGHVGVHYVPQAVSTQVVAGTNYRYKCAASIPPSDAVWEAVIDIFQPLKGKPYITGIIRI
ncbi:hypothetical protein [Rahnella woolbedingensis]|uniref:Uncharacterized protein n=1 Tax=Rahnella woolbedingensis TaxID=1510574 RepID=A0A419N371_9GAMM|nr:hypothetical protein [Rahnella woolbedingensis]RJT36282.1 hypothetical protein D6C13_22705 [Rahnella woolbedingensis]